MTDHKIGKEGSIKQTQERWRTRRNREKPPPLASSLIPKKRAVFLLGRLALVKMVSERKFVKGRSVPVLRAEP